MTRRYAALAAAGLLTVAVGACAPSTSASDEADLRVVAAFYPLQFVTERVGGDRVAVTGLAPPGVEAHDLELTPSQVLEIAEADLVVFLHDFQPAVDAAVEAHAGNALDVASAVSLIETGGDDDHGDDHGDDDHGDDYGPEDPHVWLDPDRLATIADEVAASLGAVDADHADQYAARADELRQELAALDAEFADGLADCERREIVVSHAAFGYLAERYDLTQIAVTGLSPEDEPTPQRLAEVAHEAEEHGATTIFFEVLVNPRVAEVIAEQVGAQVEVLDPIEGLAAGGDEDYFSLMRSNLTSLQTALSCT